MVRSVLHISLISLLAAVSLLLASAFAFAQEAEDADEISSTDAATTTAPEALAVPVLTNIYPVERLEFDEVANDFVLSPGKFELVMDPGETRVVQLKVANRIGEEKIFEIDIEDVGTSADPDRPAVLLGDKEGPYTLRDYITIQQKRFPLQHAERAFIPVEISIPPDAEPGGRYGSVLVKTVTRKASDGTEGAAPSSAIISRIGAWFLVTVTGEANEEGTLKAFSTRNEQTFYTEGPITFDLTYDNTGSIHLNPYGEIRIRNLLGDEVGFVEIEPWFVLPGSVRLRTVEWDREVLFGRYTATLKLNRGYDDVIDEAEITFWVLPWHIVGGTFVGLFVLFLLIRFIVRNFEFKRKQ